MGRHFRLWQCSKKNITSKSTGLKQLAAARASLFSSNNCSPLFGRYIFSKVRSSTIKIKQLFSPRYFLILSIIAMLSFFFIRAVLFNIPAERLPYEIAIPFMAGMLYLFFHLLTKYSSKAERAVGFVGLYLFGFVYIIGFFFEVIELTHK